jgi:hypothetical protein
MRTIDKARLCAWAFLLVVATAPAQVDEPGGTAPDGTWHTAGGSAARSAETATRGLRSARVVRWHYEVRRDRRGVRIMVENAHFDVDARTVEWLDPADPDLDIVARAGEKGLFRGATCSRPTARRRWSIPGPARPASSRPGSVSARCCA